VPAGIAVPTYAGVPITYPGGGDTITLVRGYESEHRTLPDIDWRSIERLDGTMICYLSTGQLPHVLEALLSHGWSPETRAVFVYDGTLPTQDTVEGTIARLREAVAQQARRGTGVLIAGRVVGFREHLRWFDTRPLFGRRVLVTRPRDQAAEVSDRLTALGAEAIEAPMIRIAPPEDSGPLDRAAADPAAFDVIVFSSGNAVDAFMSSLLEGNRDVRALSGPLLCAVGSGTADKLARHGIKVDLVPEEFRAEAVVSALASRLSLGSARVLLPRADIGREVIADSLRERGASVTEVVAYRTVLADTQRESDPDVYGLLLQGRIDVATFTSPSAVKNFVKLYGEDQAVDLLRHTAVASIGPVTSEAAAQLGINVTIQPRTYTIPAMVDAIAAHFAPTHGHPPTTNHPRP
jgi:uroporphyrinogen III methyltransferase/synthase